MPALIGHYAWMGYLALHLGFLKSVAFFTIAQCLCGLFLALVFGLGHNGMATYDADARPDFWKLQVRFSQWGCSPADVKPGYTEYSPPSYSTYNPNPWDDS